MSKQTHKVFKKKKKSLELDFEDQTSSIYVIHTWAHSGKIDASKIRLKTKTVCNGKTFSDYLYKTSSELCLWSVSRGQKISHDPNELVKRVALRCTLIKLHLQVMTFLHKHTSYKFNATITFCTSPNEQNCVKGTVPKKIFTIGIWIIFLLYKRRYFEKCTFLLVIASKKTLMSNKTGFRITIWTSALSWDSKICKCNFWVRHPIKGQFTQKF